MVPSCGYVTAITLHTWCLSWIVFLFLYLSFCWSTHVFLSFWSNVRSCQMTLISEINLLYYELQSLKVLNVDKLINRHRMSPIELIRTKKRKTWNILLKRNTQCCYKHRKCAFGQRSRGKSVTRWQEDWKGLQEIRKILRNVEDQENIRKSFKK